jgi:hypothetical protein
MMGEEEKFEVSRPNCRTVVYDQEGRSDFILPLKADFPEAGKKSKNCEWEEIPK